MVKIKSFKLLALLLSIFLFTSTLSGCWNYREIESLIVVSGIAIDKNPETNKIEVTTEFVDIKSGKEIKTEPKTITISGDTMFEIARKLITISGKRAYWSHAQVMILSETIAREGLAKIIDWYVRDAETRTDIYVCVSKEKTAKEILFAHAFTKAIVSFELASTLKNENSVSTAPLIDLWDYISDLKQEGRNAILPTVQLKGKGKEATPYVDGTAIFKADKLIATISGESSQYLLFANDKVKGGILTLGRTPEDEARSISLEIFKNKSKVKPILSNNEVEIQILIKTKVALAEIEYFEQFSSEEVRKEIEERANIMLQNNVEGVIKRLQQEYDADVFGFGEKIEKDMPNVWNSIKDDWPNKFKNLKVSVKSDIKIKNSATTNTPIEMGD
ncbi:Ger(x)C family spore germination protein [Clostridium sp. 'White wine YQ']|uniref:Ger(x)C family spore germination protein n=1 Tax=Clostridium sp. 'White wine YQ' TaxID=3027474 RepID=UPI00236683E8|nr:Ger(x)C family spore germination protein [Clostridium sp. 'White wine YQ']MDD7792878.1 Ger(x)C family spore germination protein [Clostridium sp. 'White wine YQ']